MKEKEKEYLATILNSVKIHENYTSNVYVFGNVNDNELSKELAFYGDIDSWINNINYLNQQIKVTAEAVFGILEQKKDIEYDIRGTSHKEAYYFTENMLFRISILWDLFAQMFNRVFSLNEKIDEIHHYRFFEKYQAKSLKTFPYRKLSKEVYDYFNEEDYQGEGLWKGNFQYCKRLRNDFTHSLNPHIMNFNNGIFSKDKRGMNMAEPPLFELKRLIEDFTKVNDFITVLLNEHIEDKRFFV